MELPVFLMTGFHPAGFIIGYILGLHEEVNPVFCIRTNNIEGLRNITADRLHVVSNPSEIPTNGIGIGRFMDERFNMRDGYDPYNQLMQCCPEEGFPIQAHPILMELVQFNLPQDPEGVDSDSSLASADPLTAPGSDGIIPETEVKQEIPNEPDRPASDDIVPAGEPKGTGRNGGKGAGSGAITVAKGSDS